MCGRKKGTLEISIWELGQGLAVGGALLPGLVEALMSELKLSHLRGHGVCGHRAWLQVRAWCFLEDSDGTS